MIGSVAEFVPPDFDVPLVLQASEFVPQLSGNFRLAADYLQS